MSNKEVKLHKYEFGWELSDLIDELAKEQLTPVEAVKKEGKIEILFATALSEAEEQKVKEIIQKHAPTFKLKKKEIITKKVK